MQDVELAVKVSQRVSLESFDGTVVPIPQRRPNLPCPSLT